jgi:hypothetical protein
MTCDGAFYPQPSWERRISEIGSGWLPTPTDTSKGGGSSRSGSRIGETPSLQGMARKGLWPTPKGSASGPDYARVNREESGGDDLATAVARETPGSLNPRWIEWLMAWPIGWTDLRVLAMDKFQSWLRAHGRF